MVQGIQYSEANVSYLYSSNSLLMLSILYVLSLGE